MRSNRVILVASVILILFAVVGGGLSAAPNPGWPDALSWIPFEPGPVAGLCLFGLVVLQFLGYVLRRRPTTRPTGADPVADHQRNIKALRRLAAMHPTQAVPDLAHSLFHLGEELGKTGQWSAALGSIDEGLGLARSLAVADPATHTGLLSHGLRIRAYALLGLNRHEEARQAIAEARQLEPPAGPSTSRLL